MIVKLIRQACVCFVSSMLSICLPLAGCTTDNKKLFLAIQADDTARARELVGEVDQPTPRHLQEAVTKRNRAITELMIEHGADVNHEINGVPILVEAAYLGDAEIVALLVDHGAKIEAENALGMTALNWASVNGHTEVVRALIERGADSNHGAKNGVTPLMSAGQKGHREIAELLLSAGASVDHTSAAGSTPLMEAAVGGDLEILRMELEHGAEIDARTPQRGFTAFSTAALNGNVRAATYLYEKGADPSVPADQVEINGKAQHILGDYFLSLDDYERARAAYRYAQENYGRTVEALKSEVSSLALQKGIQVVATAVLTGAAAGLQAQGQAYLAQQQSREAAEMSALRYAGQTNTGIQGYHAYMERYNQTYVPTYPSVPAVPVTLPANASLDAKKLHAEQRVLQFEALGQLIGRVLSCFDLGLTEAGLHDCVAEATAYQG